MLQKSPMYAYIPAQDIARARQFYEEKLGFKARKETGAAWSTSARHQPLPVPDAQRRHLEASQAFWQVEDVESEVAN